MTKAPWIYGYVVGFAVGRSHGFLEMLTVAAIFSLIFGVVEACRPQITRWWRSRRRRRA